VKKLYYFGRAVKGISRVRIWFGSKSLHVRELLAAIGQSIGINNESLSKIDLDAMVNDALLVKEGKLAKVPQAYEFMEGIWPPELVPLFLKAGSFPTYVDADERERKMSVCFLTGVCTTPHLTLSTFANNQLNRTLHNSRMLLATTNRSRANSRVASGVRSEGGERDKNNNN